MKDEKFQELAVKYGTHYSLVFHKEVAFTSHWVYGKSIGYCGLNHENTRVFGHFFLELWDGKNPVNTGFRSFVQKHSAHN